MYALETTFSPILMKLRQIFVLMKSQKRLKMGHGGSNAKSLSQILEKPCVRSKGHIFSPILLKLDQNICLDEILDEFDKGSCQVKD